MNFTGLLPHQPIHAQRLCTALTKVGAALDASDTGTGKTFVALCICRELGIVPLVVGPKNGKVTWERAAAKIGVEIEYINYEKVRGRRALRGGLDVDTISITENAGVLFDAPCIVVGLCGGKSVYRKPLGWGEAGALLMEAGGPATFCEFGEWKLDKPGKIGQIKTSDSDWIEEKKYGSGSFVVWKNRYTLIIFDEVHRCGGSTTLNSKLLIAAKRQAKFVLALSATAADSPYHMKALGFALGLHKLNDKQFGFRPWLLKHGCNYDAETKQVSLSLNTTRQNEAFLKMHSEIFPLRGARMRKAEIPGFPRTKLIVKLLEADATVKKASGDLHHLFEEYGSNAFLTDQWVTQMQKLEMMMVPEILDMVDDLTAESRIAIFVSYKNTREFLTAALQKKYGPDKIGWIDGSQVGPAGARQRQGFQDLFQQNKLVALVANADAGGETISMHDPEGKIERVAIITPQSSGRRLKQIFGRVDRAGGANSVQYLLYFGGTPQEETAKRVELRLNNIELLNDADLAL